MRFDKDTIEVAQGDHKRATFLVAIPTFGMVPIEFVVGFSRMQMPMNCLCESLMIKGMEVGVARNYAVEQFLKLKQRPEYLLFIGDDMLLEWNSLLHLYDEMKTGKWDMLTGLYYMKAEPPVPIIGRKEVHGALQPGVHFEPGEVVRADLSGLDFTLIRGDVFDKLGDPPWFKTSDIKDTMKKDGGIQIFTEDVFFCDKMIEAGLKIGVHTGVRIGHIYTKTGEVF